MKKLAIIIALLMVICGGALWFLASNSINEFVKQQIESQGIQLTNQAVTVESVNISLAKGAGEISHLVLNNPDGYKESYWFNIDKIALDIDTSQLKEPYTIEAIELIAPKAYIELKQNGESNIQQIYDAIKNNLPKSSGPAEPQSNKKDPLIRVEKLIIKDVNLTMDLTAIGNKVHSETLPTIDLGNIGGIEGVPASQLGGEIGKKLASSLWKITKEKHKDKFIDKIKEKAKEKLGSLLDKLGS